MTLRPYLSAILLLASAAPAFADPGAELAPRGITIHECVETALRGNVDVAVFRSEREAAELVVPMEQAAFSPRFSGDLSFSRSETPSGSSLVGTLSIDERVAKLDARIQELTRLGTTLSLSFENQREDSNTAISLLSPAYTTALTLSAHSPLLKNAGRKATEAPLTIAKAGAEAGAADWKAKVMDVVASARISFLGFFAASREVEVRTTAVSLARRLLEQTRARIQTGFAAPADRLPAVAALASRKEELLRAEATARNAEDDLKTVLGVRGDAQWEQRLIAVPPADVPAPPGPADTFEEALRRRPELSAAAARTQQAEIREALARNHTLPNLDLTASAGLSGLAGSPNPNPFFPGGGNAFEGNYADSLRELTSGKYTNWFVGLSTEIPWGRKRERAEWARARGALERQRLRVAALRMRIRAEVRKSRRDLVSALARIDAARASVSAASAQLDAEERRLALGASTTVQVLQFQHDYAQALLAEATARTDALAAQTRLWRSVGTILDREAISVR